MIDLTIQPDRRKRAIQRARERNIIIPTYKQMKNPALIPDKVKAGLKNVGLWDVNPLNLFRINWHNEPVPSGGGFGGVNYLEFPKELTGVNARIFAIVGKWFPTGAHKVGAAFQLPRAATGHRPVRSDDAEGRVAQHRQLLPRRRVRLGAAGLPVDRDSAGRHEQGTLRVAVQGRGRSHRHARHRKQRQGNLRQVLGTAPQRPRPDDLQSVRRVRQLPVALHCHRSRDGRSACRRR